ncbi:MAG: nucleoside deaminase [Candidatus Omnitrophica bacterium]|nr:nucleoside deaminase [Candidatus Omnitrophota bacterium]
MKDASFMRIAIKEGCRGAKRGDGGPFGACVVKGGRLIARGHNTVLGKNDPTGHAEINAIRAACRKLKTYILKGATIYSTTEPCPMCFAAIHWAKISRLVYGTCIKDVKKLGFNELLIPVPRLKKLGKSPVRLKSSFMRKECKGLLGYWQSLPYKKVY